MSLNKFYKVFFVLLAIGFGINYWLKHSKVPELPFFQQKLVDLNNRPTPTEAWKNKYVLVSYFQSWCGDCARELPSIQALEDKIGADNIKVVLISDEPFSKINKFKNHFRSKLPFYQSVESFNEIGIRVFPTTYLIGPNGKLLLSKLEGFDWSSPEVLHLIKQ